jgi:hypothetical protein
MIGDPGGGSVKIKDSTGANLSLAAEVAGNVHPLLSSRPSVYGRIAIRHAFQDREVKG